MPATPARRRKIRRLTWTAGASLVVGLTAGTALSVVPDGMVTGAAPVTAAAAEPESSAKPTASKQPPATKMTTAPGPTLRYPSCNDVWAGRQGPFKKGEPGYTKQLDPDGDGIACESKPK